MRKEAMREPNERNVIKQETNAANKLTNCRRLTHLFSERITKKKRRKKYATTKRGIISSKIAKS